MGLKRRLSTLDLIILGVGGAVGTGVLFGNAGMAEVAGPGVVLAWLVGRKTPGVSHGDMTLG